MRNLLLAALIFMFLSCSKSEFIFYNDSSELILNPHLVSKKTKSLTDDTNIQTNKIRVQISKADGSEYCFNNSKLILSHLGLWQLNNSFYLTREPATIYAYSPVPDNPVSVEIGQFSSLKRLLEISYPIDQESQIDYLWSKQNKISNQGVQDITSANPCVDLKLNHVLSLVSFVVYKENYSGSGQINQISIKDNSISPSFIKSKNVENNLVISIDNGSVTGGENTDLITITSINSIITESGDPGTDPEVLKNKINAYALIVPVSIIDKSKINFSFNIDGKDYSVYHTGSGLLEWKAGQQYIYKVKLSGTSIFIDDISVVSWLDSTEEITII